MRLPATSSELLCQSVHMERHADLTRTATEADGRLAFGVATGTAAAFVVFAWWPVHVENEELLLGLAPLWAMAGYFTILLGPLAAGMAGYLSFVALWLNGAELPARARRLHLVTLLVVAGLFVALVSPWGAELFSAWLGD